MNKSHWVWVFVFLALFSALTLEATSRPSPGTFSSETATVICSVIDNIRLLLEAIAGGIAVLSLMINGARILRDWAEPDSTKKAKEGIVHTFVGLIIVLMATEVVALIMAPSC